MASRRADPQFGSIVVDKEADLADIDTNEFATDDTAYVLATGQKWRLDIEKDALLPYGVNVQPIRSNFPGSAASPGIPDTTGTPNPLAIGRWYRDEDNVKQIEVPTNINALAPGQNLLVSDPMPMPVDKGFFELDFSAGYQADVANGTDITFRFAIGPVGGPYAPFAVSKAVRNQLAANLFGSSSLMARTPAMAKGVYEIVVQAFVQVAANDANIDPANFASHGALVVRTQGNV